MMKWWCEAQQLNSIMRVNCCNGGHGDYETALLYGVNTVAW